MPEDTSPKKKGIDLSKKIGPLPLGAWVGLGGVGLTFGYRWYEKRKAAAAGTTSTSNTGATVAGAGQPFASTGTGGLSGGGGGGITGGVGSGQPGRTRQTNAPTPGQGSTAATPTSSTATTSSNSVYTPPPIPEPAQSTSTATTPSPPSVTVGGTTANPNANVPTITNPSQTGAAPEAAPTLSGVAQQSTELALVNRGFSIYALDSNGNYVPTVVNGVSQKVPAGTTIGAGRYYEPTQTGTKSLSKPLSKLP